MFTGLIEGQGEVFSIDKVGNDVRIAIKPFFSFDAPVIGESVAINGACLTVESFTKESDNYTLSFFISEESLTCTTLSSLRSGSQVNMERALALGGRLGGHLVSGHIDCLGTITKIQDKGLSRLVRVNFDKKIAPYIISKGSIALDGISLTVNACGFDFLEVNVIPETWKVTSISNWKQGDRINMETDMIGKYILRSKDIEKENNKSSITPEFLRENGFF